MAKQKKTKKTKKAKIKKRWFQIQAPEIFNKMPIGEAYVTEPELLIGRQVNVNLMNLTRNVRQQNIRVKFSITGFADKVASTEIVRYQMTPASLKRIVRRKISRIDESFVVFTSDNIRIRIKPLVITRSKVQKSVETDLRKVIIAFLTSEVKKQTYVNLIRDIVGNKLQRALAEKLNKIHPVRITTIRCMYLEPEAKQKFKRGKVRIAEDKPEEKPTEELKEEGTEAEKPAEEAKHKAEAEKPEETKEKKVEKPAEPLEEKPREKKGEKSEKKEKSDKKEPKKEKSEKVERPKKKPKKD